MATPAAAPVESLASFLASIERVQSRLATIQDSARLETTLHELLPRLVELLHVRAEPEARAKLVETVSYALKWVRPLEGVKLPIVRLLASSAFVEPNSEATPYAAVLLELGAARASREEAVDALDVLLRSACWSTKHHEKTLVKLLFALLERIQATEMESETTNSGASIWRMSRLTMSARARLAPLLADACLYPHLPPDRRERLSLVLANPTARIKLSMNTLLNSASETNKLTAPELDVVLLAAVGCENASGAEESAKELGRDVLSRFRTNCTTESMTNIILLAGGEGWAPPASRISALELISKNLTSLAPGAHIALLTKSVLSALLGDPSPSALRTKAADLMTLVFLSSSLHEYTAVEALWFGSVQRRVYASPQDPGEATALYSACSAWYAKDDRPKPLDLRFPRKLVQSALSESSEDARRGAIHAVHALLSTASGALAAHAEKNEALFPAVLACGASGDWRCRLLAVELASKVFLLPDLTERSPHVHVEAAWSVIRSNGDARREVSEASMKTTDFLLSGVDDACMEKLLALYLGQSEAMTSFLDFARRWRIVKRKRESLTGDVEMIDAKSWIDFKQRLSDVIGWEQPLNYERRATNDERDVTGALRSALSCLHELVFRGREDLPADLGLAADTYAHRRGWMLEVAMTSPLDELLRVAAPFFVFYRDDFTVSCLLERLSGPAEQILVGAAALGRRGAVLGAGYLALSDARLGQALCNILLTPSKGNKKEEKLVLKALAKAFERAKNDPLETWTTSERASIVSVCKAVMERHTGDSQNEAAAVLGALGSALHVEPELREACFGILLDSRSSSALDEGMRHTVGDALGDILAIAGSLQRAYWNRYLEKLQSPDSNQVERTSAAIWMSEILKRDKSALTLSGAEEDLEQQALCLRIQALSLELLGEASPHARDCAARSLACLGLSVREFNPGLFTIMVSDLTRKLWLAMHLVAAPSSAPRAAPTPSAASESPPQTGGAEEGTPRGTNTGDQAQQQQQPQQEPVVERRPLHTQRLAIYSDVCSLATYASCSFLMYDLLALAATDDHHHETNTLSKLVRDTCDEGSKIRLTSRSFRWRFDANEIISQRVARPFYDLLKRVGESERGKEWWPSVFPHVFDDAVDALQRSHHARERTAAVLALVDLVNKAPAPDALFLERALAATFRALDDVDELVSKAPAQSLARATIRSVCAQKSEETRTAALVYVLDKGLQHSCREAKVTARSCIVSLVKSSMGVPKALSPKIIETMVRAVGEGESGALQYAQFHTRGGAGTGEVPIEGWQLEMIRAAAALTSEEYQAARLVFHKLTDREIALQALSELAKCVRLGAFGFAGSVAAVALCDFVASEEWPLSGILLPRSSLAKTLLVSLGKRVCEDASLELRKRAGVAAAKMAKHAPSLEDVAEYATKVGEAYVGDETTLEEKRLSCGEASLELARALPSNHFPGLYRACFLGRYDPDAKVAEVFRRAWNELVHPVERWSENLEICEAALRSLTYRTRRQGAEALGRVCASNARGDLTPSCADALLQACETSNWAGKDRALHALGEVRGWPQGDYASRAARVALETALDASVDQFEREACFLSLGKVARWSGLADQVFDRAIPSTLASGEALTKHPVVWAASLTCAAGLVELRGAPAPEDGARLRALALHGLAPGAPWNVRVASWRLVEKALTKQAFSTSAHRSELMELALRETREAKKAAILGAALDVLRAYADRADRGAAEWAGFERHAGLEAGRLATHADSSVQRAAVALLKLLDSNSA